MAAPTPTARVTPTGIILPDGFSSKLTLAASAAISLWETEVTPPGMEGGDRIDVTTMHNTTVMTFVPQALIDMTESSMTVGYDPNCYNQILALMNVETTITITWADGSTLAFYGYLRNFAPTGLVRGTMPTATVTVAPTNYDPVNRVEAVPVLTSVAGT